MAELPKESWVGLRDLSSVGVRGPKVPAPARSPKASTLGRQLLMWRAAVRLCGLGCHRVLFWSRVGCYLVSHGPFSGVTLDAFIFCLGRDAERADMPPDWRRIGSSACKTVTVAWALSAFSCLTAVMLGLYLGACVGTPNERSSAHGRVQPVIDSPGLASYLSMAGCGRPCWREWHPDMLYTPQNLESGRRLFRAKLCGSL